MLTDISADSQDWIIRDSRDSRVAHEFLLAYSVSADFWAADVNKKANRAADRGSWWKSWLIAIWAPKCLLVMMRTLWVLLTKICSVQFVIWLCENRFSPDVATDSVGNVSTDTWRGFSLLFIFENNVFSLLGSFPLKCLNRYKISSKLCLCRKLINLYRGKCSRNVG